MRRWIAAPVVALLVLAACGGKDDVEGADDEQAVVADDVGTAVEIARMSLPASFGQAEVAELIEDLCVAAATGDVDAVVAGLVAAADDPNQLGSNVDALAAGAGTYCPDDVDEAAAKVQQAVGATTTTSAAPVAASDAGAGGGSAARSSSGSSSAGSRAGGATNQSSGSASVGGGNATGSGNQSSTEFSQGVTSGNGASGGSSASSTTTG